MAGVQAHTARLIALFVSCVLYGILLTTFVPCIRSLLFSATEKFQFKPRRDIKFPILVASILMFLVSSFSAVLSMQDVIDAFIDYDGPGGALEFYHDVNYGWKHWMPAIEDTVQVILGDALLIYRCYILHDRSLLAIALPAVSWLGLCGLIVRRLFTVEQRKDLRGSIEPHFLSRVATIFFESGMIYSLSVVASLGVYLTGSNLQYVATLAMIHIIPITCNVLLIRVGAIGRTQKPSIHSSSETVPIESKYSAKAEDAV